MSKVLGVGTRFRESANSPTPAVLRYNYDHALATLDQPFPSQAPSLDISRETGILQSWWAPTGLTASEPAELPAPKWSVESRALENILVSHFDGHDLSLPPLLNGAERVLTKLRDTKCSLNDVAAIVAEDPVIAAAVLRTANSALYRGLQKITALPAAINRLGFNSLRTLMLRESLRSAMFDRSGGGESFAKLIWRRALVSGTVMQGLSHFTNIPPDDAFLYGLLHDLGNIIVLRIVQEHQETTGGEIDTETFEYFCSECHQEFGEIIAEAWKLPADVRALVSDHHHFPVDDDPMQVERLQLLVADQITILLGYAPGEPFHLLETRAARALELSRRADFTRFLQDLPAEIEDILSGV